MVLFGVVWPRQGHAVRLAAVLPRALLSVLPARRYPARRITLRGILVVTYFEELIRGMPCSMLKDSGTNASSAETTLPCCKECRIYITHQHGAVDNTQQSSYTSIEELLHSAHLGGSMLQAAGRGGV